MEGYVLGRGARTPNDPKLSDSGVRRGTCMVGGKAEAEAGAVTHGAVRCSAWLGVWVAVWKDEGCMVGKGEWEERKKQQAAARGRGAEKSDRAWP